jgi:EmrB/QacA subfamily drug resistance transporter
VDEAVDSEPRPAVDSDEMPVPVRTGLVLLVITVGTFLAPLDSSIVNIALPDIAAQFSASLTAVGWVSSAYLLTSAALVLTMGRLGDIWGLRKVYIVGFLLFGVGSLACAISPTLAILVLSRVSQAVGAAMMFASGPAIITNVFPPGKRGRALGTMALAVSAGLMLGPTLGGVLLGAFGWPSIFLVNIPLAIVVAFAAWRLLPPDEPESARFDLAGALLAAMALVSLLLALSEGNEFGWGSPLVVGLFVLGVASGWAFVLLEKRLEHPMLDLALLENWAFSAGALAAIMTYLSFATVTFLMPFYLLKAQGVSPALAGLIMAAPPAVMSVMAPVAGRLSDSWGSRGLATTGLVIASSSLVALSFLGPDSPLWLVALEAGTMGLGAALFGSPNTSAVLSETPSARRGIGSAVVANARNVGMAVGIALSGAIVVFALGGSDMLSRAGALAPADARVFLDAFSLALRVGAGVGLTGAVVSWSRGPSKR